MESPELDRIGRALARAFPELDVEPLHHVATGFGSVVVETLGGVIFRVARSKPVSNGHAVEVQALPMLATRLPAPIPLPEWRVEPGDPDLPFGAIGYRRLPGQPLEPEHAWRELADELAVFFVALHAIPRSEAEAAGVPPAGSLRDHVRGTRDAVLPRVRGAVGRDEYRRLERRLDSLEGDETLYRFDPVPRHGDPWYGNVLVDEQGRLAGVIDWEGLDLGDPAWEATAQMYLGAAFVERFLDAYGADDAFRYRARRFAELREFGGVRRAVEADDQEELEDAVRKLMSSPMLAATPRPRRR
jgi:aminoglycoside phosphotransferase (APT) family kinase protein